MDQIVKVLKTLMLIIACICFACCKQEIKFDRIKWNEKIDPAFPPPLREKMLLDLTTNHKLVGLRYNQLIDTLGKPDLNDSSSLAYMIKEGFGGDIDPVYTKDLVFYFSKNDSVITSFKIREWQKDK